MRATCLLLRSLGPSTDTSPIAARLEAHTSTCLFCQAEIARYGKLRRQLAALADFVEEAPAFLVRDVDQAISHSDSSATADARESHLGRVVAGAGAVAAAAAGAAAVAVWRNSKAAV
ncbi:MAG: hypothetical protein U9N84_09880 [Actinomycetota bacterium]|nr:hypothetical protein [Actinomycetota bacterium]